ncbi:MAG TPA: hypothetical protein VKT30_17930 [Caulobacteraceae bacterium]|nr:hypothetical protein [Caulobacteraceae bacterium]
MASKAGEIVAAADASHGQKMVELRVRFWTNDIAGGGKILPKHAWAAGIVRMESNPAHGIKAKNPVPFNSLAELAVVVERVLIDHGVKLHPSTKERKYRRPPP